MKWLPALLLALPLCAADGPRLFYSRDFPGSVPAYFQVTIAQDGAGEYAEAVDDELPLKFRLSEAETAEFFELAAKLERFQNPLESPLKVAFMGKKTFRYENGAQKGQQQFNFTEDLNGRALQDLFERAAESAQLRADVERAAKYDKLGVVKTLNRLILIQDRKRLLAQAQFLPILDRIAKNETYMHQARQMASEIAEMIRTPKP